MRPSLISLGRVDCRMKTAREQNEDQQRASMASFPPFFISLSETPRRGQRTIFVSNTFTDCDAGLLIRVLQDHNLGQLAAEAVVILELVFAAKNCFCRTQGSLPIRHELGKLRVTVASQQLDGVGRHGGEREVKFLVFQEESKEKEPSACEALKNSNPAPAILGPAFFFVSRDYSPPLHRHPDLCSALRREPR